MILDRFRNNKKHPQENASQTAKQSPVGMAQSTIQNIENGQQFTAQSQMGMLQGMLPFFASAAFAIKESGTTELSFDEKISQIYKLANIESLNEISGNISKLEGEAKKYLDTRSHLVGLANSHELRKKIYALKQIKLISNSIDSGVKAALGIASASVNPVGVPNALQTSSNLGSSLAVCGQQALVDAFQKEIEDIEGLESALIAVDEEIEQINIIIDFLSNLKIKINENNVRALRLKNSAQQKVGDELFNMYETAKTNGVFPPRILKQYNEERRENFIDDHILTDDDILTNEEKSKDFKRWFEHGKENEAENAFEVVNKINNDMIKKIDGFLEGDCPNNFLKALEEDRQAINKVKEAGVKHVDLIHLAESCKLDEINIATIIEKITSIETFNYELSDKRLQNILGSMKDGLKKCTHYYKVPKTIKSIYLLSKIEKMMPASVVPNEIKKIGQLLDVSEAVYNLFVFYKKAHGKSIKEIIGSGHHSLFLKMYNFSKTLVDTFDSNKPNLGMKKHTEVAVFYLYSQLVRNLSLEDANNDKTKMIIKEFAIELADGFLSKKNVVHSIVLKELHAIQDIKIFEERLSEYKGMSSQNDLLRYLKKSFNEQPEISDTSTKNDVECVKKVGMFSDSKIPQNEPAGKQYCPQL